MEKGFMLPVLCKPAAGAELANTAAAPKTPHIRNLRQQTCTLCARHHRPLSPELQVPSSSSHHQLLLRVEGIGVCGGEYSSARLISEAQIAEFWSYSFGSQNS